MKTLKKSITITIVVLISINIGYFLADTMYKATKNSKGIEIVDKSLNFLVW